jgi:4-hydroxybenzoate polyprenyltransferase
MTSQTLTFADGLRLGRVSNLPTVWSNGVAGIILSGGTLFSARGAAVILALSLFYTAGMYLNDAFDRDFDRQFKPDRPIPAGRVSAETVFGIGFGMLALGLLLLISTSWAGVLAAAALCGAIVLYDAWHKGNPLSPFLMGLCRTLAYLTAGYAVTGDGSNGLWIASGVTLSYLIGLTYAAKQESLLRVTSLWPLAFLVAPLVWGVAMARHGDLTIVLGLTAAVAVWTGWSVSLLLRGGPAIGRAVVSLIAGISLVDALFVGAAGAGAAVAFCILCFLLTAWLQRYIAGT